MSELFPSVENLYVGADAAAKCAAWPPPLPLVERDADRSSAFGIHQPPRGSGLRDGDRPRGDRSAAGEVRSDYWL